MKKLSKRNIVIGAVVATTLLVGDMVQGQTLLVNDWYAQAPNGTSISNGDSSTATLNYGDTGNVTNAAQTYFWSYFVPNASPVALTDGMSLTFSSSLEVDFVSASSRTINLRFGLYDSSEPRATTASYGTDRIGTGTENRGWTGAFTITGASDLYRKNDGNTAAYANSVGTSTTTLTDSADDQTFDDGVALDFSLSLSRSGDDLLFAGLLGASNSFSGTYTNYFVTEPNTFDAFGFYLGSAGTGSAAANSITFSDAMVTVVPEPTTLAFFGVGIFGILAGRRTRQSCRHS